MLPAILFQELTGMEYEAESRGANAAIRQSALQANISVLLLRMYGSEKLSDTADVCEMDESLKTAFVQLNGLFPERQWCSQG